MNYDHKFFLYRWEQFSNGTDQGINNYRNFISHCSEYESKIFKRTICTVNQYLGNLIFPDAICNSCGHVVRDFESEAKTRYNFQFR